MMMEHKQTILLAPSLSNSSCWRNGTPDATWTGPGPGELIRATLILLLSIGILCANLLVICVINSRQYSKYIHAQPRYLLTSLASNDLAIGLLVTPFGFLPAVYGCWPYGEVVCQIQALLRGALTQQSAVILVCMAIDRYVCMLHPHRYHKHSSKRYYMRQGCVAVMSTTWIASVAIFGVLVLPRGGYYFNGSGLLACDPFFARASLRYRHSESPVISLTDLARRVLYATSVTNCEQLQFNVENAVAPSIVLGEHRGDQP